MDWISFLGGVGAFLFVNIVYAIWVFPKQRKREAESINRYYNIVSSLESFVSEHEEKLVLLEKERDKVMLALETLESSIKLRKSCPACGVEFPLYILEEKVK